MVQILVDHIIPINQKSGICVISCDAPTVIVTKFVEICDVLQVIWLVKSRL